MGDAQLRLGCFSLSLRVVSSSMRGQLSKIPLVKVVWPCLTHT